MLDTFENGLSPQALDQPRYITIGACYSGSFIDTIKKSGRTIITSAKETEQSFRGPNEPDNIRSGEYFLDEYYGALKKGTSIRDAFNSATANTANFTRRGGIVSAFGDRPLQNPLISVSGLSGATWLPTGYDDNAPDTLYLGAGDDAAYNPSALVRTDRSAEIEAIFLDDKTFSATISAKAPAGQIAWFEYRAPSNKLTATGGSSQLEVNLPKVEMTYDTTTGAYSGTYANFREQGTYDITVYLQNAGGDITRKHINLYRNRPDNTAPLAATLVSPADRGEAQTTLVPTWLMATDPDGDMVSYTLVVSKQLNMNSPVLIKEGITDTYAIITHDDDGLLDLTTYYWQIWAIDSYGSITKSTTRSFSTNNKNGLPGLISGYVRDSDSNPIPGATVTLNNGATMNSLPNGAYILLVEPDTYNLTTTAAGYNPKSNSLLAVSGQPTLNDITLAAKTPTSYAITTALSGLGLGYIDCPSTVREGTRMVCQIQAVANYKLVEIGKASGDCTGTLNGSQFIAESITGNCSVTAKFNGLPINGVCGSDNGGTFTIAPTTNLCTAGTTTAVTGNGPWNWSCSGTDGGTTATCNAGIKTWTITATVTGGNGTFTCTTPVNHSATSTCTVMPSTGYQLATLTDNIADRKTSVAGGSYTISNVTTNHVIDATFNLISNNADTTPPTLSVSTLANNATTTNPTLNVAGIAHDSGSGVKSVTVNGQTATIASDGTFSVSTTLANGSNNLTAIATDNANNQTSDTRSIILDRAAPSLTITFPVDNSVTNKNFVGITGSVDNQHTTVITKVNGGSATTAAMSGTNFISTLGLTSGMNTIDITATNLAGKSSSAKRTVTSNSTAPTLSITSPDQDSSTKEGSITISGTVTDTAISATISISADGQTYTPTVATNGSFSQTINLTTDKTYAIVITATDQASNKATAQRNIIKSTKAKVFLGTGDNFTVSTSGTTLYGGAGNGAVTINDVVTGVILDQNIGQINLPGTSNDYTFKQTGNMINVYDITGTTLIVRAPVQGDADGTQISFSNGTASASTKLSGGIMTLGEKTVSTATATTLDPTTITTTTTPATTKAKVFLSADESFTVSSSGTILYGNSGKGIVTITTGTTDVTLDQNIGQINLSNTLSSYKFKQTGNMINVYDTADNLIVKAPVQGDADGTILSFGNQGAASAKLSGGVMVLGGKTVSTGTATTLSPLLTPVQ